MSLRRLTRTRLAVAAASAAGVLVAASLAAAPAQATTLTVSLSCQGLGAYQFTCEAAPSGGVPPYTYQWSGFNATGHGTCGPPVASYTESVKVTDSAGATASASSGFTCYGGPPR